MRPLSWTVSGTSTPRAPSQPGHVAAQPGRSHDRVGLEAGAVLELHAGDHRRAVAFLGDEPGDGRSGEEADAGLGPGRPPQHPLEGGPAHDEHLEVFVARLRLAELGGHRQDQAADRQQLVEDVGQVLAQLHEDAGEEPVGLVDLRRAPSLGLERLLGVGPHRQGVALDQRDLVAGPSEGERERQPADPTAHHHDPFPHRHAHLGMVTGVANHRRPRRLGRDPR